MKLSDALSMERGDVIAFVGAGGKTSAMFRLAEELSEAGWRVITTTTTRLAGEELRLAPHPHQITEGQDLASLPELVQQYRHVLLFDSLDSHDKVIGVAPDWIDKQLARAAWVDTVLVEADGSRRLPMKAPYPHEPVIPESATVVVPVAGLKIIGRPLNRTTVYGAEFIQTAFGISEDSAVTSELVASVMLDARFGRKGIPSGARVIPLLNQITPALLDEGRNVARQLLADPHIEKVLLGAVREESCIVEVHRRVGAIILAAGQSTRMGEPKLLLPWDRETIIRRVCSQVAACGLYEIVVVAGALEEEIHKQVQDLPVRVVFNPRYAQGEMLSSLQVGLQAIWQTCDACLVVLGDQPMIQPDIIRALLDAYNRGMGELIAPSYHQRRGHPLIIGKKYWEGIMALPSGGAPRDLLRAHPDEIYHLIVETDTILGDIDTPEDYRRALDETAQGKPLPPGH